MDASSQATDTTISAHAKSALRTKRAYLTQIAGAHRRIRTGLSIRKRVMEAHGGSIAVEQHAGRGTWFVSTFTKRAFASPRDMLLWPVAATE